MKRSLWIPLLLPSVLLCGGPLGATSLPNLEARNQVDRAEAIFVARVEAISTLPTLDASFAFTHVTFDIEELVKGAVAKDPFVLEMAGGAVGTEEVRVGGAPEFVVGERYLVFAEGNTLVPSPVLGGEQGYFRFAPDPTETAKFLLVDGSERVVAALTDGAWSYAHRVLDNTGEWASPREETSLVSGAEGVTIRFPGNTDRQLPSSADEVLAALRALVVQRSTAVEYLSAPALPSADPTTPRVTYP